MDRLVVIALVLTAAIVASVMRARRLKMMELKPEVQVCRYTQLHIFIETLFYKLMFPKITMLLGKYQ